MRVRGRGATAEAAIRARLKKEAGLLEANPTPENVTVRQLSERWLSSAHASRWSSETTRSYTVALKNHVLPEIGAAKLGMLTAFDIQRVMDRVMRESSGKHVSVANRSRRVMHAMFGQAVAWGLLRFNPVASVRAVRLPSKEQAWWTREQALAFLEAAGKSPYAELFHAALTTGLRIGELLALRWQDVGNGVVTVRRSFSQSAPGKVQEHPKSARGRRDVPLPAELSAALEARRGDAGLVFGSRSGKMLNPSNVRRALRTYAVRAGVPVIRVHDLRRTYASLLAEAGYHPSVIQRLLGHSSPELALRVYTSVRESSVAGAVVSLGGSFGSNLHGQHSPEPDRMAGYGSSEKSEQAEESRRAPVAQLDRAGDS